MSAEDQIKLVDEYEKKKFTRDAIYGGISKLGASTQLSMLKSLP